MKENDIRQIIRKLIKEEKDLTAKKLRFISNDNNLFDVYVKETPLIYISYIDVPNSVKFAYNYRNLAEVLDTDIESIIKFLKEHPLYNILESDKPVRIAFIRSISRLNLNELTRGLGITNVRFTD